MLRRIHEMGYCYTNLNAKHFLVGMGTHLGKFYMCGLQHLYEFCDASGNIIPPKFTGTMIGIDNYSSINRLSGLSTSIVWLYRNANAILLTTGPTPRDDLESLGYILLDLFKGGRNFSWKLHSKHQRVATLFDEVNVTSWNEVKRTGDLNRICKGAPSNPYLSLQSLIYLRGNANLLQSVK